MNQKLEIKTPNFFCYEVEIIIYFVLLATDDSGFEGRISDQTPAIKIKFSFTDNQLTHTVLGDIRVVILHTRC